MNASKANRMIMFTLLLIPALFLSGCFAMPRQSAQSPYHLTVINQSAVPIHQIQYSHFGSSGGAMNADGSPLGRGDQIILDFALPEGEVLLSARNAQDETLGAKKIQLQFNQDTEMTVFIRESPAGLDFQLDP